MKLYCFHCVYVLQNAASLIRIYNPTNGEMETFHERGTGAIDSFVRLVERARESERTHVVQMNALWYDEPIWATTIVDGMAVCSVHIEESVINWQRMRRYR